MRRSYAPCVVGVVAGVGWDGGKNDDRGRGREDEIRPSAGE
jgi:hypothetical protein